MSKAKKGKKRKYLGIMAHFAAVPKKEEPAGVDPKEESAASSAPASETTELGTSSRSSRGKTVLASPHVGGMVRSARV